MPMPEIELYHETTRTLSPPSKLSIISANEVGAKMAAPTPCINRAPIKLTAVADTPAQSVPPPKNNSEAVIMSCRPSTSLILPPISIRLPQANT